MLACKGICDRYAVGKDSHFERIGDRVYRYLGGHKRCNICEVFLKVDGNACPCCGLKLRQSPRGMKYKWQLRRMKGDSE